MMTPYEKNLHIQTCTMLYLLNLEYDFHKEQYCMFQYFQAPNYKNNNIYSKKNLNIPNFQLTRDII